MDSIHALIECVSIFVLWGFGVAPPNHRVVYGHPQVQRLHSYFRGSLPPPSIGRGFSRPMVKAMPPIMRPLYAALLHELTRSKGTAATHVWVLLCIKLNHIWVILCIKLTHIWVFMYKIDPYLAHFYI